MKNVSSKFLINFYVILILGALKLFEFTTGYAAVQDSVMSIRPLKLESDCVLPQHPNFGQWTILPNGSVSKLPSDKVDAITVLQFVCDEGYMLSSKNEHIVCLGIHWSVPEMPTCLKKCAALHTTKSTSIKCFDDRHIQIKCDEATEGAVATFECAPYYEPSNQTPHQIFCFGGIWNNPQPVCHPVCGGKKVSAQPLIVNGKTIQNGDYPWVAAVFQESDNDLFINVCGGTMLTQKIILTAAHCVTDDSGNKLPKEDIMVAVGKYYNKYKDPRDTQAQYSKLDKIEVPNKYKGAAQRFASDIAILVTKDILLLSKVVQPVCYLNIQNIYLNHKSVGVISGWGYTTVVGQQSEELKEIDVLYKEDSDCYNETSPDWLNKYSTYDKMCAGYNNKSKIICRGDSGGGLLFKHNNRYFVHGVLSVSPMSHNGCIIQDNALYTKVSAHYDWLEHVIAKNNFLAL